MADPEKAMDLLSLKNTKITVLVEEALQDILVVTYEIEEKIFRGVLLDSTKKNLPCGVSALHPSFNTKPKPEDDPLYSANQRFAYTDPSLVKKNIRPAAKYKNGRMTVRLRPRQVLCSKCKSICNENSESVSRKRKTLEHIPPPPSKRSANAPVTRSVVSEQNKDKAEKMEKKKNYELMPSLIPKLSRLLPQDITDALEGNVKKLNEIDEKSRKGSVSVKSEENTQSNSAKEEPADLPTLESSCFEDSEIVVTTKSGKRTLRKKRSVGSMEDLWDESVFEEGNKNVQNLNGNSVDGSNQMGANTRTIKISYGPQGAGTVLKIPAPIEKFGSSEETVTTSNEAKPKNVDNKAVRKAMKRARKKARQKITTGTSPNYISSSPRYTIGSSSPRYGIMNTSPRHYIGNNSPRYVTSSTLELEVPKRHKHKLKRKRRHRDEKDRKHRDSDENSNKDESPTGHKFSINLKKLQGEFIACPKDGGDNTSSSDEHSEQMPDFPPCISPPLTTPTVTSVACADGGKLIVGDVVWGKMHGFPWWPGKVLTISTAQNQTQQAHVSWYGSSTSSLIECDQLNSYLDNFKIRYNKKKRGVYKEAIRQATSDAKENAEKSKRDSLVNSPAHIITVPPPTLASPREIDVMS